MLDLDVFRNPRFSGASVAVTAVYFCLFGTIFLLTQHLQELLGYGALAAGIRTVPFAVVLMIVANLTPRVVGRFGPRLPIVVGLLVVAASQLLRIASTPDFRLRDHPRQPADVRRRHGPARSRRRPRRSWDRCPRRGPAMGSAINDTTRQVGGALGVAVMGSVAAAGFRSDLVHRIPTVADRCRATRSAPRSSRRARSAAAAPRTQLADAAQHAFIHGLRLASLVAFVVALVGAFARLAACCPAVSRSRPPHCNRVAVPARHGGRGVSPAAGVALLRAIQSGALPEPGIARLLGFTFTRGRPRRRRGHARDPRRHDQPDGQRARRDRGDAARHRDGLRGAHRARRRRGVHDDRPARALRAGGRPGDRRHAPPAPSCTAVADSPPPRAASSTSTAASSRTAPPAA